MNTAWRRGLRRTWFGIGGAVAGLAIALALALALAQLLLPLAAHYPQRIEQLLSASLHRPVRFASIHGQWQLSGPLLTLTDVRIGQHDGKPALTLPSATIKVDLGALLWPSRHWINLRLQHLRLDLIRQADGHWRVAGFGASSAKQREPVALDALPANVWLDDVTLDVRDARSARDYTAHASDVRISNGSGQLRFSGWLRRQPGARPVQVIGAIRDGGDSGRLYLSADGVDFGRLLHGIALAGAHVSAGNGKLRLWLGWRNGDVNALTLDAHLRGLHVTGNAGDLNLPTLDGLLHYRHGGGQRQVTLLPGKTGALQVTLRDEKHGVDARVSTHNLHPGGWLGAAAWWPGLPEQWRRWLLAASPQVHVKQASAHWSSAAGLEQLQVKFDHLGFASSGAMPGLDHLHGTVRGDGQAMALYLPQQAVDLSLPQVFHQPLAFTALAGDIVAWRSPQGWRITSPQLQFASPQLAGQLRGGVRLDPQAGLVMNAYAALTGVSVPGARQLLPAGVMHPKLLAWLNRALLAGRVDHARMLIHGALRDWPFSNHHGRIEVDAQASGVTLKFDPDWPSLTDADIHGRFIDDSMLLVATAGRLHGIALKHGVAFIPDYADRDLMLNLRGSGSGVDAMGLIRASPVGRPHKKVLAGLQLGGQAAVNVTMILPLSQRNSSHPPLEPFTLAGRVDLADASIVNPDWGLNLKHVDGRLYLGGDGFHGSELTARMQDEPVTFGVAVGSATGHPGWPVTARLRGSFSMAELAQGHPALAPLAPVTSGNAPFDIRFHATSADEQGGSGRDVLQVQSDLRGMAIDLPAPLAKPAAESLPMKLTLDLPLAGAHLRLALGQRLHARARLAPAAGTGAVAVRLGASTPTLPLPASGMRIRGHSEKLDVSGWTRLGMARARRKTGQAGADIDVSTDHAEAFGSDFGAMRIRLAAHDGAEQLRFTGPNADGSVSIPLTGLEQSGISAHYTRLYWPVPASATGQAAPVGAPAAAGSVSTPTAAPTHSARAVAIDPASLPPLHIRIDDLRLGKANLGDVTLETRPTSQGMHIEKLETRSKAEQISATGDWNGQDGASRTHMAIQFDTGDLGQMLGAFGFPGVLVGGKTHAEFDAAWPGSPSAFALADVSGTLKVDVGHGRIPELSPGLGKLLGLMSLPALPRHLTIGLGSIFAKGFSFNSIDGQFRLADGAAFTRNLVIKGSAAKFEVSGRVGLRAHDYDQTVVVIPHVGNSLPLVGAIVGGPIGAAAGLAIQGLLGHGLNKAASARYHITGSWAHPQVTAVGQQPAAAASAASPVAPPGRYMYPYAWPSGSGR